MIIPAPNALAGIAVGLVNDGLSACLIASVAWGISWSIYQWITGFTNASGRIKEKLLFYSVVPQAGGRLLFLFKVIIIEFVVASFTSGLFSLASMYLKNKFL